MSSGELRKFYAVAQIDNFEVPENIATSKLHLHISSAIDEAIENVKEYLKNSGLNGNFATNVLVFVREESVTRLIETVKAKIRT
ncbi:MULTISPECIES: hypothetical protein [Acidianus]|uniref:Uncharacterized protein n=1 Tax=Candidatus Acidianus copahuensis TaxID=1160895 RepID=A0A031LM34_9CREN|nr:MULTISPECIES: hypothetical protein [Acidianus]EZQ03206.1 hypothetical protein CM19_10295 [Candidatus Acidianus copahuensis]NON63518.1 hypothetical protein [Acidianus sp. RZ1]